MAYDMNGGGARLSVDGITGANVGTGDFAISAIVNSRDVSAATQKGFFQISSTSGGLSTSYTNGLILAFGLNGSGLDLNGGLVANVSGTWIGSSSTVSANTDLRIIVTRASGTLTIYVNGSAHASAAGITASLTGQNICIGGYYSTSYTLIGTISEFALWNTSLNLADAGSFNRGFTPDQIRPQSLQFYATLVRDLVDVRGGRTITNNSATVATHPRIIT